jgi:hypothetical protein
MMSASLAILFVGVVAVGLSGCSPAQSPRLPEDQTQPTSSASPSPTAPQVPPRFGGAYAGLDERRQRLVNNWVARFNEVTGQNVEPGPFYDTYAKLSAKTTFDAVTHALMTTSLTDRSGVHLGDALDLIDRVESLRGEVVGASGDRQFRIYAGLKTGAIETLSRSEEFKRGADNSVYHKGYPINYRQQAGCHPSSSRCRWTGAGPTSTWTDVAGGRP